MQNVFNRSLFNLIKKHRSSSLSRFIIHFSWFLLIPGMTIFVGSGVVLGFTIAPASTQNVKQASVDNKINRGRV